MASNLFITRDATAVKAELVARYQQLTGRTLHDLDPEMFFIHLMVYREIAWASQLEAAGKQNLIDFATAPVLDYLARFYRVTRLGASPARCTLRFALIAGHGGVIVPTGTRVRTPDGRAVFQTTAAVAAATGAAYVDAAAECQQLGTTGNGYAAGTVSAIMDPQAFITTAQNLELTAGGAEIETDDALRERVKLSMESFSVAGPRGAYKYWAKTANAGIVDVAVTSPPPGGIVRLFPLMEDGQPTPTLVLNQVLAICSADTIRPLCDTVQVVSPSRINYALAVNLTLYLWADPASVVAQVEANLAAFVAERRRQLGQDVVSTQIIAQAQIAGVYRVELPGFSDITVGETEFPYCTSVAVQVVGTTQG